MKGKPEDNLLIFSFLGGNYFQSTNSCLSDKTHKTILIHIHSLPDFFFLFSGVVSGFEPSGGRLTLRQETGLGSQ